MNKIKGTGLQKTPVDARDYPLGAIVGLAKISALPKSYTVADPLGIKDQGSTDMCTAFALSSVSEDQEGILLDPGYTFFQTKQITGQPDEWGADLRSACKSATKFGFLPLKRDPAIMITQNDRERFARGLDFTIADDGVAANYKKRTFLSVKSSYDMFDSIRSAMWQTRDEERSVFTGCLWRSEWSDIKGGVVDVAGPRTGFGHAVKAFGWDGDRLLLQLSNGKEIGDNGVFLLHRDVVNEAFTYDGFTFLDMPRIQVEYEIKKNTTTDFLDRIRLGVDYWLKQIFS